MIPIAKPLITKDEEKAVMEVLSKGQLASGEYVTKFEDMFKDYLGCKYALCTTNGTTALHAALLGTGIGKGDLVITTPFSFIATSNAILYVGATPLFADVEEDTFNIDPDKVENLIKNTKGKIKAMIIVHLFGNPCDMERIVEICKKYDIILIEDCAQAHGAEFRQKKVGTFGAVSAFSFYPTKNMTCGEGGMVVTNDEKVYDFVKKIINHGQVQRYQHDILGYNFRMTNISAAIGIEQLKKIDYFNNLRIYNAYRYLKELNRDRFILPIVNNNTKHVFHQFSIRCKESRSKVINLLEKNEIGYGIYYPTILPDQPLYKKLNISSNCPVSQKLCEEVLAIPVHPALSEHDVNKIIEVLNY